MLDRTATTLGGLVVLAKQFWRLKKILLTSEGIVRFENRMDRVCQVLMEQRFEDADPPEFVITGQNFHAWAQGATVLATWLGFAYQKLQLSLTLPPARWSGSSAMRPTTRRPS